MRELEVYFAICPLCKKRSKKLWYDFPGLICTKVYCSGCKQRFNAVISPKKCYICHRRMNCLSMPRGKLVKDEKKVIDYDWSK